MRNIFLAAKEAPKRKRFLTHENSLDKQTPKKLDSAIKRPKNGDNGSKISAPKKAGETKAVAKRSRARQTGSSVLIKVSEGNTFADALGTIREEVHPDANRATVVTARTTQKGDVLILLDNK